MNNISLKPFLIMDKQTGELIQQEQLVKSVTSLTAFIKTWVDSILEDETELNNIHERVSQLGKIPSNPAELARQIDYKIDYKTLPQEVLGKSRVNKLAGYSLTTSYFSWFNSPNQDKQKSQSGKTLVLGAVDKQYAYLVIGEDKLILTVKLWDKEYELHFIVPKYVRKRQVSKWALPNIRVKEEEVLFDFSYIEQVIKKQGSETVGVDLGKVKAYQAVVVNEKGLKTAQYAPSGYVKLTNQKLERIIRNRKQVQRKISVYQELGLQGEQLDKLLLENKRLKRKSAKLREALSKQNAAQLIRKLGKHDISKVHLENLKWVTGKKYGSHWDHSRQAHAIKHRSQRAGYQVKQINPKNTSQKCCNCGKKVIMKKRLVYCSSCKVTLCRDLNAAINIANDINNTTKKFPTRCKRPSRDNCNPIITQDRLETNIKQFHFKVSTKNNHSDNKALLKEPMSSNE